jgi:DNA-binding cell septation regulator SpoVG
MDWARILAYMTGTVDQELLAQNEYLQDGSKVMFVAILQRRRQIQNAGLRAPMTFPRPA